MGGAKRRRFNINSETKQSFPYIPEELIVDILSRLPVQTLLRFRCVSKPWCDLISRTKIQKKDKLLCISLRKSSGYKKFTYQFSSMDTRKKFQEIGEHELQSGCLGAHAKEVMGSCNGLLLIKDNAQLFLWNPSIRYCKKVFSDYRLCDEDYRVVAGLCFDSHTNDYKAVIAFYPSYGCEFVSVYSCKTKSWTNNIHFPYSVISVCPGPVFNNYLHWFASPEDSYGKMQCHCIIYFDVSTNKFERLPMPEAVTRMGDNLLGLGVLDGCLCMTRFDGKSQGTAQVLAMKEYGQKESWTLLFQVTSDLSELWGSLVPSFYSEKKGEVLMVSKNGPFGAAIVAYDIEKKTRKIVKKLRAHEDAVVYEETFARPTEDQCNDRKLRMKVLRQNAKRRRCGKGTSRQNWGRSRHGCKLLYFRFC